VDCQCFVPSFALVPGYDKLGTPGESGGSATNVSQASANDPRDFFHGISLHITQYHLPRTPHQTFSYGLAANTPAMR
jgi:hypothetical protein